MRRADAHVHLRSGPSGASVTGHNSRSWLDGMAADNSYADGIRAAGTVSYRTFATARGLERLLAEDLAVLLSESFAGVAGGAKAPAGRPVHGLAGAVVVV